MTRGNYASPAGVMFTRDIGDAIYHVGLILARLTSCDARSITEVSFIEFMESSSSREGDARKARKARVLQDCWRHKGKREKKKRRRQRVNAAWSN
jgi:hypothetical protein